MSDYIVPEGGSPNPPKRGWRVVGRHKGIAHAVITESVAEDAAGRYWRRFTATVYGYQRFRLVAGVTYDPAVGGAICKPAGARLVDLAFAMVRAVRDEIGESGEEARCFDGSEFSTWKVLPYRGWEENS